MFHFTRDLLCISFYGKDHVVFPFLGLESSPPPEVIKISINKGNKGMGVSIVAAKVS